MEYDALREAANIGPPVGAWLYRWAVLAGAAAIIGLLVAVIRIGAWWADKTDPDRDDAAT